MVLHAPGQERRARDALHGPVVEVAVGQLYVVCKRVLGDGEAVVLARYLYMSGPEVSHGMIGAVVAEGHFVRLATEGEELVPEADAERGDLTEQRAQGRDGLSERRRVTWSVGEEQAVRSFGEYFVRARGAGHGQDGGAAAAEFLVNGTLHPVVQRDDTATFLSEGREQGRLCEFGTGGGEVEADHGRVGGGACS